MQVQLLFEATKFLRTYNMKPYGREKTVRFSYKKDCHPRKGWHNWWETMADYLSRTEIKRRVKKDIDKQINEKD